MIEVQELSKSFGSKKALRNVSFRAEDGKVTGFLGPNGAGKSTTMRAALNLIHADSGRVLIDGKQYSSLRSPLTEVGAVLDARSAHKGRSAYNHLLSLALTNRIPKRRVDEVIDITGIGSVKKRKAGAFSLGMSQRLSIAAALLGDPQNLVLDEPINGLDPEGVKWVRELCRYYASEGKAVLLSSHLMSEVALTADNLVIIGQGNILETTTVPQFVLEHSLHALRVATPEPEKLRLMFELSNEVRIEEVPRVNSDPDAGNVFRITGIGLEDVAKAFAAHQLLVFELREERATLEEAYMALTHGEVEYVAREVPGVNSPQTQFDGSGTSTQTSAPMRQNQHVEADTGVTQ